MLHPSRVLPSNAPPLQDGSDGLHQASRVLQEHSGNRQQQQPHDFNSVGDWGQTKYLYDQQKYPANVLSGENAYPRYHVPQHQGHQQQQHLYHPQPQHRHPWRYGYARGPFALDEPALQYQAERLYRRFRQSDQYVKYRTRQSKEDKGNGDQKWPDHLEKAFFRALITYPPMGRRKQLHKEKQRGRNELIADCIEELTGEARTRKQVSSHIQVLKPFVENDPMIMKWLSKDDLTGQMSRYHGHSYPTGRRMSNYPVTAPPHSMRSTMPSLSRTDAYGVQQLKQSPQAFEPADFQMFLQRKYKQAGKEEIDRLHTYSQAIPHPLAEDHPMSDWHTLSRDFPKLAEAHAQRPLDCTVLIAEASLAFPTESMDKWKGREGASIELGIYFQCRSRMLPPPRPGMKSPVSLVNNFHNQGETSAENKGLRETTEVYFHPVADNSTGTASVETEIKFGSTFWARTLGHVGSKMRGPVELTPMQREEMKEYVRSLGALQEIYVSTERGQERVAVIHWNFRLSSGDCGRVSWRRLILPESTTGIYTAPPPAQKTERADSFYDYASSLGDFAGPQNSQAQQSLPTLQSPFEYDNSANSSTNSALSSATWSTSLGDANDFGTADNSFDFNSIVYDASAEATAEVLNFDINFDSSAFNFDDAVDFAADPALQDFSQQNWYDDATFSTQTHGIDVGGDAEASFATQTEFDAGAGSQLYAAFDTGTGEQGYSQGYAASDQQAFGGAGPEAMKEEDAALAALANASAEVWARGYGEGR